MCGQGRVSLEIDDTNDKFDEQSEPGVGHASFHIF